MRSCGLLSVLAVVLVTLLSAVPSRSLAQSSDAQVSPASAPSQRALRGRQLFTEKGCQGCHSIGRGKMAGPDLLNITQRVPADWLRRFLRDPRGLYDAGDPRTVALVEQHHGYVMPNFRLKDQEIDLLIAFLGSGLKR